MRGKPDFYTLMPTYIHTSYCHSLHLSSPYFSSFSLNTFITFCAHTLPLFLNASSYQCEWLWEAESSATGMCALTFQAWSLIQWDQRLSTQDPFITMTPSACQQQYVRPAGKAGEGLMPVIFEQFQPFTHSCNFFSGRWVCLCP